MNRVDLIAHIERHIEESAQMGEPPSFAFENVADAEQLLMILRGSHPSEESIMYAKRTFDPNVTTWSHDMTRTMAAEILRIAGQKVPIIAESTETKQ